MAGLVSTSRCPAARGEGAVSGQNISGVVGLSAMAARRCDDDAEKRAVEVEDVMTEIECTMALPNSSSIQLVASMASIAVTATNASGDFTGTGALDVPRAGHWLQGCRYTALALLSVAQASLQGTSPPGRHTRTAGAVAAD